MDLKESTRDPTEPDTARDLDGVATRVHPANRRDGPLPGPAGGAEDLDAGQIPCPPTRQRASGRTASWRPFFDGVLVALLVALYARTFLVQAFRIPTPSMEPNLLVGDHIVVDKTAFAPARWDWERRLLGSRRPRPGEVVVFRSPTDPGVAFLKRIVAVGGQRIAIHDKELFVDGRSAPGEWAHFRDPRVYPDTPFLDPAYRRRDQLSSVTVPPGTVFLLGDNRDRSWDSRHWGPIQEERLIGPALLVYASIAPSAEAPDAPWWRRIRWSRTGYEVR